MVFSPFSLKKPVFPFRRSEIPEDRIGFTVPEIGRTGSYTDPIPLPPVGRGNPIPLLPVGQACRR